MPTCKVNNVELYYEVNGEGRPIVFTHGASWNHKQWDAQVEFFSENYQTIVWDVRGHGNSTLPEEDFDSEDFSRDLIGLLDHLQIDQAILCGLSMGGHISLQTAIRYPERVSALVLIGTPFTNTFDWLEKLFIPLNRWSHQFIPMSYVANFQASILSTSNNNVTKRYIEEAVSSMSHKNWLRIWNAVTSMESGEDLGKIDCPTLILQGEHDSMIKRQQHYMNKCIKKSKFVIVENANHATNLDNPTEVNQLINQFLQLSGTA